jgi:hypothetical protein
MVRLESGHSLPGDKILEIDDHPIKTYGPPSQDSITWRVITSKGPQIKLAYQVLARCWQETNSFRHADQSERPNGINAKRYVRFE